MKWLWGLRERKDAATKLELQLDENAAMALVDKAIALDRLSRFDDAISVRDEVGLGHCKQAACRSSSSGC